MKYHLSICLFYLTLMLRGRAQLFLTDPRRYLPNNLNEFNTNDLLCGLSNVPDNENATLFSKVQDLILHSKRFA